jgi:hypothetical protein
MWRPKAYYEEENKVKCREWLENEWLCEHPSTVPEVDRNHRFTDRIVCTQCRCPRPCAPTLVWFKRVYVRYSWFWQNLFRGVDARDPKRKRP